VSLDLGENAAEVYDYVISRVSKHTLRGGESITVLIRKGTVPFSSNENWDSPPLVHSPILTGDSGPGGTNPIYMIYAGYEFHQAGWFALVFDRRPDAGHDGEWTRYLENNMLERPHWVSAAVLSGDKFSRSLGEMLMGVLKRAERDGVFSTLPLVIG
jgi:hypothetical protein